jgi:microcystin-dependent protein
MPHFSPLIRPVIQRGFLALALLLSADRGLAQATGTTGSGQPISNLKSTLFLHYIICVQGVFPVSGGGTLEPVDRTTPFIGEIKAVAISALPTGYMECDGHTLTPSSYTALYTILGTTYGGDGSTTFALPDLRDAVPIGAGPGPGGQFYSLGQRTGTNSIYLSSGNLPAHTHTLPGGGNTGSTGGGLPFGTLQPSVAINFLIDADGQIAMFAGNFAPQGWAFCDGSLFAMSSYPTLNSYIGTTFGGDGVTTFAVPDLRGRSPAGLGGNPPATVSLGGQYGAATITLNQLNLPSHNHSIPGGTTGNTGSSQQLDVRQPILGMTWAMMETGLIPGGNSPFMGEMRLFPGTPLSGTGTWIQASGQTLPISVYSSLFSYIGTTFGGNGISTFGVPNLAGNLATDLGNGYFLGQLGGSSFLTLTTPNMTPHAHALPFAPTLTGAQWKTNGAFQFSFTNIPNNSFTVLTATNLTLPGSNWTAIATITNISPGQYQFTSTPTNEPERFYQIRNP